MKLWCDFWTKQECIKFSSLLFKNLDLIIIQYAIKSVTSHMAGQMNLNDQSHLNSLSFFNQDQKEISIHDIFSLQSQNYQLRIFNDSKCEEVDQINRNTKDWVSDFNQEAFQMQNQRSSSYFLEESNQFHAQQNYFKPDCLYQLKSTSISKNNQENLMKINDQSSFQEKKINQKIFRYEKIKGKFHKNTNVPKMLVRIFMKHYSSLNVGKKHPKLKYFHNQIKLKMNSRQTNNYKISDVIELLQAGASQIPEAGRLNRETLSKIILHTMREQIILNKFVKRNEMSYMMALKIYSLRCRSRNLVERVKIM